MNDTPILVTGCAGSIGSALVKELLNRGYRNVKGMDISEYNLFILKDMLSDKKGFSCEVGDVRDLETCRRACKGMGMVFHAAALKHVPICEENPYQAIQTNVIGTHNLLIAASEAKVKKFMLISTDKAADPINSMGASKFIAEKLTINHNSKMKTACIRFGNVLNTSGSILPIFKKQLSEGKPLTVTDPLMTRFFISIEKAVDSVLKAMSHMDGGEVFIIRMRSISIARILEAIQEVYASKGDPIQIKTIGIRPGEKMHELLLSQSTICKAIMTPTFIVLYPNRQGTIPKEAFTECNSATADSISVAELKDLLSFILV
jgi:UDP-N-acetylglucosamine 4,6-dehydratase/5-epimerase